ncbi:MAG: glycosyltransferase family 2 protein [Leptolyngbyaceae cyanobacterium RM1_1_2]|nr:glycosyltransferase family 2 protein [Leptolyngbyaceae cyanobacterium RM1_1_2]
MKPIELDVIIPVKDRATVGQCVSNLLAQIELVEGMGLGQILLCDGGSCQSDCQQQIRQVAQSPSVIALACPHLGFNKGWLLNQGLEAATAPIVLISDVDILWNAAVLSSLGTAAASHPERLYYVRSVQESQPTAAAVQRLRYAYRLERLAAGDRVEVYPALPPQRRSPWLRPNLRTAYPAASGGGLSSWLPGLGLGRSGFADTDSASWL